jgi:hypothetical protein
MSGGDRLLGSCGRTFNWFQAILIRYGDKVRIAIFSNYSSQSTTFSPRHYLVLNFRDTTRGGAFPLSRVLGIASFPLLSHC